MVKAVTNYIWHLPNECYKNFNSYNDIEEVVTDAVKQLPSTNDNWIPVSEKLPEESEEVLVTDIWGCIHIESLEVSIENIKYWEDCDGNFDYFDEIIAWQPLPTPYKESEVQNESRRNTLP